ncbi:hypothetical protein BKA61DRAFT_599224 [Leptodontidium sp. MPI-SDFR-AT-0119]|nr:hypothetical protein BKA61DRAFT_599224 [Leptodontidium sp. MPI-SDFR-AT-0119]
MPRKRNLQFVWPKDGPKGRGHRGFWGRLDNIITGKGPDVFLQHKGSKQPITRDEWQNWDSYAFRSAHDAEELNPVSRGFERYDPYTRKYVEWATPHDWCGVGVDGWGVGPNNAGRTRFTREEKIKLNKIRQRGGKILPSEMGSDWNNEGPKRFRPEYNDFWRNAHRQCENDHLGLPLLHDPNPLMQAYQRDWWDLQNWMRREL